MIVSKRQFITINSLAKKFYKKVGDLEHSTVSSCGVYTESDESYTVDASVILIPHYIKPFSWATLEGGQSHCIRGQEFFYKTLALMI